MSKAEPIITSYVTGPVKIGHVGTNYILSHYGSYLNTEMAFMHSVTFNILPIKY